ncbi:hypothetical protein K788_00003815 [Paraburkholderia caribensis MBA4]|uniref:Lipoprotein n=1 Tax=Paraburkholderia caribensis MBA4 TaxID=1323664 RepID=A0A0P0RIA1_9BURK|nr:hypothetical protein [Paraburkholderia caribensis]ALL68218.1 hypothetical protein K788_00003815 [Paraburkholderia caribensis MBA4]
MIKSSFLFWLLIFSQSAFAGEAITFDNPGLNVVLASGRIAGYYTAVEGNKSCDFYFFGSEDYARKDSNGYTVIDIQTFATQWEKFTYVERDRDFDIKGHIYRIGDKWIVQTTDEPPGCGGAVGLFTKGPNDDHPFIYSVKRRFSAVAIRVVSRKTYLYRRSGNSFKKGGGYLTEGDNVVALNTEGGFTNVRYTDPNYFSKKPGAVTVGWVRSSDLLDPFPPTPAK